MPSRTYPPPLLVVQEYVPLKLVVPAPVAHTGVGVVGGPAIQAIVKPDAAGKLSLSCHPLAGGVRLTPTGE